ncbi:hypothetical protein BHE74_00003262 [Ensete ventricosum]|nr:hypothetical protein BHE74_00003262 [Ensete ventricosum]RZR83804.1 hypothetical protein BHM03_00010499 [Ensete ventricosum]
MCSYAATIGSKIFVTSAKSGTGVDEVFIDITTRELPIHIIKNSFSVLSGLLQKKKNSTDGLSPALPKRGILVVDDEPEKEPPPKCCS